MALRGVLQILHTPFHENGDIDWRSYDRQIAFCCQVGVHGVVVPANASEFYTLSESERFEVVERAAKEVGGRIPLVVGVQAQTVRLARAFAEHALEHNADAIMAMPPLLRNATAPVVREYYQSLSALGTDVIIQNAPSPIGTPQSPAALRDLIHAGEHIAYVKEEVPPILHRISQVVALAGHDAKGVFGGANGLIMVEELDRGGCGNMPAGGLVDVQVKIFNAYDAGRRSEAIELQSRIFPLLFHASTHGAVFHKYLLWRRGVLASPAVRDPQAVYLDEEDERTIEDRIERLSDLLDASAPFGTVATGRRTGVRR